MKNPSRRLLFKSTIISVFGFTSLLAAEEKPEMKISYLTNVLRSINNPVCKKRLTIFYR